MTERKPFVGEWTTYRTSVHGPSGGELGYKRVTADGHAEIYLYRTGHGWTVEAFVSEAPGRATNLGTAHLPATTLRDVENAKASAMTCAARLLGDWYASRIRSAN
ncbi:hypothetical protein [Microbispora sp. NPDC049125]|uniref:hypothetical protein n=1 Tax=Microbispora sp. NPDC049125 TaxID=3154929 RepID=UPI003465F689